jgi:hypothetical protein
MKIIRTLGKTVIILGIVSIIAGAIFLFMGFSKQQSLVAAMRSENITLGDLGITGPDAGKLVDSMSTAQLAGDTVKSHRHNLAPSYKAALGGGRFDPTNPQQLTYVQAMNLEAYLYLAVASFGLAYVVLGIGAIAVVTGISLMLIGIALQKFPDK